VRVASQRQFALAGNWDSPQVDKSLPGPARGLKGLKCPSLYLHGAYPPNIKSGARAQRKSLSCHVYNCFLPLTTSSSQVKKIESLVNVNFSTPWVQYEPVKKFGSQAQSKNSISLQPNSRELEKNAIVNMPSLSIYAGRRFRTVVSTCQHGL
jgi:hypothetical protein